MQPFILRGQVIDPPLLLAPMMDITGRAFRAVIRRCGGCSLFYSEMLNSRRVPQEKDDSPIFKGFGEEKNLVLQLLGHDPKALSDSVKRLEAFSPYGFDLNMGCSRAPITRHGWGAALLSDIRCAASAVNAMRLATDKPLTVKIRNAWNTAEATRGFLRMLELEGADAVIMHPRTPEKIFSRPAKWEWIAQAKSMLRIPVIGNGDVATPDDAVDMFSSTGCDAVMIGRAAVYAPAIFRDSAAKLAGNEVLIRPKASEIFEWFVLELGEDLESPKRFKELRTFCEHFAKGLPVPHWFWGPLQGQREAAKIIALARDFLARNGL